MDEQQGYRIDSVEPESIAADLGLQAGDRLLALDGQAIEDLFDYRLKQLKTQLLVSVLQAGQWIEYDIEKEEADDLGLTFEHPLMQACTTCDNHCLFCFIDQLPPGLRKSLYLKDDDLRLSFLEGTYATLTNLTDEALDRLISYRFSPMNVSVHTTDPLLRKKMLRNRKAGRVLDQLQRIAQAGLLLNIQIVLCPGLNDGQALDQTLTDLVNLGPSLNSVAIVPVGLTRHRTQNGLYPLRAFSAEEARDLIQQVEAWQEGERSRGKGRVVYASDEFFILAGLPMPQTSYYETFAQLENGVGMVALMRQQLTDALATGQPAAALGQQHILIGTGTAAAPFLTAFQPQLERRLGAAVTVVPFVNAFFGPQITVAGLVTGQDVLAQARPLIQQLTQSGQGVLLVLPVSMTRQGEPVFLDDLTVSDVQQDLGVPVRLCETDGASLVGLLDDWVGGGVAS